MAMNQVNKKRNRKSTRMSKLILLMMMIIMAIDFYFWIHFESSLNLIKFVVCEEKQKKNSLNQWWSKWMIWKKNFTLCAILIYILYLFSFVFKYIKTSHYFIDGDTKFNKDKYWLMFSIVKYFFIELWIL